MDPEKPLAPHDDALDGLKRARPLNEKLEIIHRDIRRRHHFIDRVAVAAYEPKRKMLRTFLGSGEAKPLVRYEAPLDGAPSLVKILETGKPRVVNDLDLFRKGEHEHTKAIKDEGYRSSYTMPLHLNGNFWGFLFYNSYEKDRFTPEVLNDLDVYGHLVECLVMSEITAVRTLAAAVKTAHEMVHLRDPETGAHLDRMAEYARMIAQTLAESGKHTFDDEYIEHIYLFAPLHDLGKIGIPDHILLKAGRLSDKEYEAMKAHSRKGAQMIETIAHNFGFEHFSKVDVLRNIARHHHEAIDGTGYPSRLLGDEIPIEARIIAVADIFDALTSRRPYKEPWPNDRAFEMLITLSRHKLDAECVSALIANRSRIEKVQDRFGHG